MDTRILLGTESGLWQLRGEALEPVDSFTARTVTALAHDGQETWAIVEGRALWHGDGRCWDERAVIEGHAATCLAPAPDGLLIGTAQARLLEMGGPRRAPQAPLAPRHGTAVPLRDCRFDLDALRPVESFDSAEGREAWHTPWGDPADVRSIAVARDGTLHVNVHVGGVVRSRDGGRTWTPTVDIETDVHQVLAHPTRADVVLAAAYEGFGISRNGGDSWQFVADGMHAHYARAVAVAGETVLVSASTGPGGRRAALYRRPLDSDAPFTRCDEGLPWFNDNIDTACLAADGSLVVFGTDDGRVFRSLDAGAHWSLVTKGLPTITAVTIG